MEIKEINNKEIWEGFWAECGEKTFLQSWNWGEFQKMQGNKIWRLGIYESKLLGAALIVKIKAKRGTFLLVPHGPAAKNPNVKAQILKILLEKLKETAKKERASFIRINPIWKKTEEDEKIFKDLRFKNSPLHVHYEITWELNIEPDEEQLLAGMRKTTRYLIKQAEKNPDIQIVKSRDISDLKKFSEVYAETVKRQKFTPFSPSFLENEFQCFSEENQVVIFLGKYKEEIVSSAIVVFWQNIGFYHHGASLSKYNNNKTPISYLLQWEAIKEAKKRGCKKYDFWGVVPDAKNKKGAWAGFSLFKMGFGGSLKECVKTKDFALSPKYYLTYIFEKIRKIKRRV